MCQKSSPFENNKIYLIIYTEGNDNNANSKM